MPMTNANEQLAAAEQVRRACIETARVAYFDAAASGLCGEGALEAALGAVQSLDLDAVLRKAQPLPPS